MDVLVVLPTYNEAKTLERIVSGVVAGGSGVLIVDDDSPDGTGKLADDLAQTHAAVSVLHRERKEGLGRAYAAGFEVALDSGASIICEMDADGSHDPAAVAHLSNALLAGADLAIGSRFVPGGRFEGIPIARRLLSRLGNLYANLALGLGVRDATSGLRAYRADLLDDLDPSTAVSRGYGFQIEMAWRARLAGARIVEVPITFPPRTHGVSKLDPGVVVEAFAHVTRWGLSRLASRYRDVRRRNSR